MFRPSKKYPSRDTIPLKILVHAIYTKKIFFHSMGLFLSCIDSISVHGTRSYHIKFIVFKMRKRMMFQGCKFLQWSFARNSGLQSVNELTILLLWDSNLRPTHQRLHWRVGHPHPIDDSAITDSQAGDSVLWPIQIHFSITLPSSLLIFVPPFQWRRLLQLLKIIFRSHTCMMTQFARCIYCKRIHEQQSCSTCSEFKNKTSQNLHGDNNVKYCGLVHKRMKWKMNMHGTQGENTKFAGLVKNKLGQRE